MDINHCYTSHIDDSLKGAVFNPTISGTYELNVYYHGEPLDGFPVYLDIGDLGPRLGSPKKSFGGNGSQIGKLSDPRGVACDRSGRVIVSDSRNHRIQVGFLLARFHASIYTTDHIFGLGANTGFFVTKLYNEPYIFCKTSITL